MGAAVDVVDSIPKLAEILETVYRADLELDAWIDGLLEATGTEVAAIGQRRNGRDEIDRLRGETHAVELARSICSTSESGSLLPPMSMPAVSNGTQSEVMGSIPAPFSSEYARAGVGDIWGLFARSACGANLWCSRRLPRRARSAPAARRFWDAVSIHLTAGLRLRTALAAPAEAVLAPDGKLVHAEGVAVDPGFRDSLRRAAQAIDRARVTTDDPVAAIETWTALVEGRWSLVDEFESDGRHLLVARVNEPSLPTCLDLSMRERHVAKLAAMGRSNKQIAYELGVELGTVASYLKRARQKLGGISRTELIARFG